MAFAASKLPSITRFLTGLVSNRNPVDTPFSLQGNNTILHHDVLNDGLNTEVSAFNTMQRRPGYTSFINTIAKDVWSYKDLNGAISVFVDSGTALQLGATPVWTNSAGASNWTLEGRGNFLYAANGVDSIRLNYNNFAFPVQWGQSSPQLKPVVSLQTLGYFNAVTGFIPAADTIAGNLVITDSIHTRQLTITINAASVHFNITYTGSEVTPNQSYTQLTVQTQTGTAPNTTTSDVVTVINGYTTTFSFTGVTNGVTNYYPQTGTTTTDFDMVYTAPMTLTKLQGLIALANTYTYPAGASIPLTAIQNCQIFVTASIVNGLYHQPGAYPVAGQTGIAMNITGGSQAGGTAIGSSQLQVNSGLFDITNPQLPLGTNIGVAPRLYQYVSPLVNTTDLLSGTLQFGTTSGGPAAVFTFTNKTLFQIGNAVNGIIISGSYQTEYIQNGSTCYLIVRSISPAATTGAPSTTDNVLEFLQNTVIDNSDLNLNFQNWTFIESNDYCQLPQQGVQITYATRDIISGGLSNVAPPVTIGQQLYPCRWNVILNLPSVLYDHTVTNIECYRTVDGGSSFLFEQLVAYLNGTSYQTLNFAIPDNGLNDQLIGPIDEENDPPPIGLSQITSHTGRMWGKVGNKVYYSGGPETVNGNGDETWPPNNYFAYPGPVIDIKSLGSGLAVALTDDIHMVSGVDPSSYYSKPWLIGFGISNYQAWTRDGAAFYIYTTKNQLHELTPDGGKEVGFDIGDLLLSTFPATTSSLTFHRNSALDTALYISNGTDTIFRYNPSQRAWSPKAVPVSPISAGRVKSLEVATAINTLLNAAHSGVWQRQLNTFADNNIAYPAFFTVGVIQLAPQGQRETVTSIAMQFSRVGTVPQVWALFNEINSLFVPFTRIINPVADPPNAPQSQSLGALRWYTEQILTPFPTGTQLVNLASVKVVFATEVAKNEIYGLFMRNTV